MQRTDVYTHGHQDCVLRSHRWRTAENSAAYLLPLLRPGDRLLDVGCGPGTITEDLARRLAPGIVVGIDASAEVVALAQAGPGALARFEVGDVYRLPFDDGSWDVVHAHQVLQHLSDPVAALVEMRRVARPGGLVAVRDSDYSGFRWSPASAALERWNDLYHAVARRNGAEPDAGRFLEEWAREAGLRDVVATASCWTFATPAEAAWWSGLWADRIERSDLAAQAVDYGLASERELASIAEGWRSWARAAGACFVVTHGEIVGRA